MDISAYVGKVVEILPGFQETEILYFEPGMLARIKSIVDERDNCTKITLDVSEFEDRNRPLETSDYNGKGRSNLTAREAGYFEVCGENWLGPISEYTKFFRVLPEDDERADVWKSFVERENQNLTYTEWCEAEIIRLKKLIGTPA